MKTYTQEELLKIANKLFTDNREYEGTDDIDKNPYAAGRDFGDADETWNRLQRRTSELLIFYCYHIGQQFFLYIFRKKYDNSKNQAYFVHREK